MTKPFRYFLVAFLFLPAAFAAETPKQVTFMAYNVENYVRMDRFVPGQGKQNNAPKPETEIAALISIIRSEKPDIIGVCEMGAPAEFQDFLDRLKQAGLDFPYTEYVQALDLERHLALASRFPISARHSQTNLSFNLDGKKQYYKRGILDVVIDVSGDYQLHLLGTHLKSKREVPEDQSLLRRAEAHLLRLHARDILSKAPATRLLVYGDLNDTINEAPIREIMGRKNAIDYLKPIDLRDANGYKWTHYWDFTDTYSRIDFILASRSAAQDLDFENCHIPSPANWNEASDHRPLVVVLKTSR